MKKDSRANHARYVELNLFPEEKEDYQKDTVSSENEENHTSPDKEYDLTGLFERLSKSAFRSRFHLSKRDKEYIAEKGLETIRKHAEDFVAKRLAPAVIPNDGKQTPMRGHPVFIAQHATGCCCMSRLKHRLSIFFCSLSISESPSMMSLALSAS